jgi:CubicO group peptidase (beta-lactamase class C family)
MKLVQEGKLGLDEPVAHRLTRWKLTGPDSYSDRVTVRHLLSHTAGLDEGAGFGAGVPVDEPLPMLEDALASAPVSVASEPGTNMVYGNANFAILQLLIEEITGREFAVYMKESVLQPLGMTHSSFDLAKGRDRDLAPNFDSWLRPQPLLKYTASSAVALYATAEDLGRFAAAFSGDNPVLKPETLRQMMTPQDNTAGTWGLGLHLFAENGTGGHIVGHDGGAYPAWGSMVRTNPMTGNGFSLMVSGSRGAVNQLGHDWVYWETGTMTFEGRRQIFYDRMFKGAGLLAIALGVIAIIVVQIFRSRSSARPVSA